MKRAICIPVFAIGVLISLSCAVCAGISVMPIVQEQEKDLRIARLGQIAILADNISCGKEHLLINHGAGANPNIGRPLRPVEMRDEKDEKQLVSPFLSAFPVSSPVEAKLPDIGEGKILGAISSLVPVSGPDAKEKAPQGVYMLFLPKPPVKGGVTETTLPLLLISITVDNEGKVIYKEVGRASAKRGSGIGEAATAQETNIRNILPGIYAKIDFLTGQVNMYWENESYSFSLALDIIYV